MNSYLERVIDLDWQAQMPESELTLRFSWLVDEGILPRTVHLLQTLLAGLGDLRYTVYECARRSDITGAKVVSQAVVEHYLRVQYLLVVQFHQPQDSLTQRYIDAQTIQAVMLYWQAEYVACNQNAKQPFSLSLIWNRLTSEQPYLAGYCLEEAQGLLDEFAWASITSTLEASKVRAERCFTTTMILEHARSHCWVQGGLLRDHASGLYAHEADQTAELNRLCSGALRLSLGAKMYCCYLFERYHENFNRINERLRPIVLELESLEAIAE